MARLRSWLAARGTHLGDVAEALRSSLPNVISVRYDAHGSANHERAVAQDLVDKLHARNQAPADGLPAEERV